MRVSGTISDRDYDCDVGVVAVCAECLVAVQQPAIFGLPGTHAGAARVRA